MQTQAKKTSKPDVRECNKIRSCYPATGNWYVLTMDHHDNRLFIDRVIMWALVENSEQVDHIRAITSDGQPQEHYSEASDLLFLHGPDMSPIGKTWDEVYAAATQNRMFCREVTDLFPGHFDAIK